MCKGQRLVVCWINGRFRIRSVWDMMFCVKEKVLVGRAGLSERGSKMKGEKGLDVGTL